MKFVLARCSLQHLLIHFLCCWVIFGRLYCYLQPPPPGRQLPWGHREVHRGVQRMQGQDEQAGLDHPQQPRGVLPAALDLHQGGGGLLPCAGARREQREGPAATRASHGGAGAVSVAKGGVKVALLRFSCECFSTLLLVLLVLLVFVCVACTACVVEGNRYRSALADIRKVLMIDPTIRVMHLPPSLSSPLPRVAHTC